MLHWLRAATRPGPLWRDRDFRRLWFGETIHQFGGQVSSLAIPLMAALLLNATPTEMGILGGPHAHGRSAGMASRAGASAAACHGGQAGYRADHVHRRGTRAAAMRSFA